MVAAERPAAGADRRRDPGHLARAAAGARTSRRQRAAAGRHGRSASARTGRSRPATASVLRCASGHGRRCGCDFDADTCAACWSTCWTTRGVMPAGRPMSIQVATQLTAGGQVTPVGLERRPAAGAIGASAICSSPSSRRKAAPAAWACTSAANCASATAPPSATSASAASHAAPAWRATNSSSPSRPRTCRRHDQPRRRTATDTPWH